MKKGGAGTREIWLDVRASETSGMILGLPGGYNRDKNENTGVPRNSQWPWWEVGQTDVGKVGVGPPLWRMFFSPGLQDQRMGSLHSGIEVPACCLWRCCGSPRKTQACVKGNASVHCPYGHSVDHP